MFQTLETLVTEQMCDVVAPTGDQIVNRDDVVTIGDQAVAQMGTDETGSARDQYSQ